jgi:YHS domain-containing protein
MIRRMIAFAALAGTLALASHTGIAQPDKKLTPAEQAKTKKALQEIQDFIGTWNLEGTQKVGNKTEAWKEKVNWGWKFKDGNAWLIVSFAEGKGKYYTEGELRYDVDKKKYLLTLVPAGKGPKEEYIGDFKTGTLKVERKDPKTGDVYRLTMNTLSEGERFAFKSDKQDGGRGLFSALYKMDGSKDGLVKGGPKKPECVVSGGAATIQVSHNGKTYYVCCSGCRDEFNANPAKYAK